MVNAVSARRLTTIVAADVAGYSRLTAADEEGTLDALRAHRAELIDPKIVEFDGRIANTAGDSLLIEFASVVNAVRAALEIQAGMAARNADIPPERRIEFRVGINVGDVVAEGEDLLGDGVNVAARLEAMAELGGITLSGTAYDQVRDRIDVTFEDLGEVEVKNLPRPVRAYRVAVEGTAKPPRRRSGNTTRRYAAACVVLLVVVAGAAAWWWTMRPEFTPADPNAMAHALPAKPSIAVLPFDNLSKDPEQDVFSDGITDDIITDLSKISGIFVTARQSTKAYKEAPGTTRRIAEDLED
jgi:adenylate cyclase